MTNRRCVIYRIQSSKRGFPFFFSPPSFFLKYYDGNFIRNEDALRALISSVFFFFFFNRKKRTRREISVEKQIAIGRNRIRGISDRGRGRRRISYPRGGAKSEATEKRKRTFSPSLFLAVISRSISVERERERGRRKRSCEVVRRSNLLAVEKGSTVQILGHRISCSSQPSRTGRIQSVRIRIRRDGRTKTCKKFNCA